MHTHSKRSCADLIVKVLMMFFYSFFCNLDTDKSDKFSSLAAADTKIGMLKNTRT